MREKFTEILAGKRAALFDFDGVIADSEYYHFASYRDVFQRRYGHEIDPDEYWLYWSSRGEGIPGEMRRHNLEGVDQAAIKEEKDRIYLDHCRSGRIRLFDGAVDLMKAAEAAGLKTAIASNSPREWIEAIFEANKETYRPPFLVGKTPAMRSKPAPDIFLAAAREVGEEPGGCVVFEDAEKGLEAALEARMQCIVILNPLNKGIEFPMADLVIPSHKELLSFFLGREERSHS